MDKNLFSGFNEVSKTIFENNKAKGFWDKERNFGELLMLVVSELGEAMEAHRKGRFAKLDQYKYVGKNEPVSEEEWNKINFENCIKDTMEDEIADAIIRLFDLCGGLNIDIEAHLTEKIRYNKTRPKLHGKKY